METKMNLIITEADLERMQAEVDEALRLREDERNEADEDELEGSKIA